MVAVCSCVFSVVCLCVVWFLWLVCGLMCDVVRFCAVVVLSFVWFNSCVCVVSL